MTVNPPSISAKGEDPSHPCACGSMISSKDSHHLCIACLGVRRTQAMVANPECCPHCSFFPLRVLERRMRVVAANKEDPSFSVGYHPWRKTGLLSKPSSLSKES